MWKLYTASGPPAVSISALLAPVHLGLGPREPVRLRYEPLEDGGGLQAAPGGPEPRVDSPGERHRSVVILCASARTGGGRGLAVRYFLAVRGSHPPGGRSRSRARPRPRAAEAPA